MYMTNQHIEPINLVDDRIRFYCLHRDGVYKLFMGNNMTREFTDETLPDDIKALIGMINAFDWEKLERDYYSGTDGPNGDDYDQFLWAAKSYYPQATADIGWRLEDHYALVVPYNYFLTLKGQES